MGGTVTNPVDQPDDERWGLVFPFVVCQSHGGPYDDTAFVAGYQAGRIDSALAAATAVGVDRATFTVRTALTPQLELVGMHHGFTDIRATEVKAAADGSYPAMPEWSTVVFAKTEGTP
jgi:hypothetical protein